MAEKKLKLYDENSIESLDPREFTRLRPHVYVGSTEYSTQLLVEIIANAVDEFRLGNATTIDIEVNRPDGSISVADDGQGFIPGLYREEDGKTVLEAAFSVLNTSGKYREDGTYEGTSLGSYGIGSKLACFLSSKLRVETFRDGKTEEVIFEDGVFAQRRILKDYSAKPHGTTVQWKPDPQFFTNPEVEVNKVKDLLKVISCLCPGLVINFKDGENEIKYYSENGLIDLIDDKIREKELIDNRFISNSSVGKEKLDLILTYTSNYSSTIIPYVNTGLTEKGPHISQIKTILTREFNKFFKEKKWLKDKEENLSGDDIQEGLYMIFNVTAPNVAYDAQVKSTVTKIDIKNVLQIFTEQLREWLHTNEKEIKFIADKALRARKAREAARKARDNARKSAAKKEKALKFNSKLADCFSKNRDKCEIYVVEGDSAAGNLKQARNNEFVAILPVRGKILNCQRSSLEKIQKNAEIQTMIDAFGLTVDSKTMKLTYKPEELRYGKIIICSDADVDGAHIKNLFYTFIWNFCPQLFADGYIYAMVPPLYKVQETKDTYIYLKDDAELEEYLNKHRGKREYSIKRLKGLGEMSVDDTEETLLNPENRILRQITLKDFEQADKLFEDLMGTAVTPRKEFVQKHSHEAKEFD